MKSGDHRESSDATLLELTLAQPDSDTGRRAASELFGRYHARVYRWCRNMVRDPERALELAQEVMLSAYRGLPSFGSRARFSSWLFSIARNRCLSELRRPPLLIDEGAEPEARAGGEPWPDLDLESREDLDRLLDLIRDHLEPGEQEALWLRAHEGMPVEEITRTLALENVSGARALLQTARRKLRAALRASNEQRGTQ